MKAIYCLRTSGAHWNEKLSDTLSKMGYRPTLADPDLWYRNVGDCYEYVSVYVDDLCHIGAEPQQVHYTLKHKYHFKLKGVKNIDYHLVGNFYRKSEGVLCWGSQTYIKNMSDNYERQLGSFPSKKASFPLVDDDHPELDNFCF